VHGQVVVLRADRSGLVVGEGARLPGPAELAPRRGAVELADPTA
jgi:hypothetical protein